MEMAIECPNCGRPMKRIVVDKNPFRTIIELVCENCGTKITIKKH